MATEDKPEAERKHAQGIKLLMDAITYASNEELGAKNRIHEAQQMLDSGTMPNAAAIMMVNAKDSMEQQQATVTTLWESINVLVADRKAGQDNEREV